MRIRSIKPSFFMDDSLADLAPLARLLFIGLWCGADGHGRLEDRPRRLAASVLPYDDADVDALLDALVSAGKIERYEALGVRVINIPGFLEHQRISGKEADEPSKYPPPVAAEKPEKQWGSNGEAVTASPFDPGTQRGSNGEAVTALEGKGREGKGRESVSRAYLDEPEPVTPEAAFEFYREILVPVGWVDHRNMTKGMRWSLLRETSVACGAERDETPAMFAAALEKLAAAKWLLKHRRRGLDYILAAGEDRLRKAREGQLDDFERKPTGSGQPPPMDAAVAAEVDAILRGDE